MSQKKQTQKNGPGKPGPGRPKGVPNRTTTLLKDAILKAAEDAGNNIEPGAGMVGYLTQLAQTEPKAFSTLLGRVLPMQVVGENDGPIQVVVRRYADD